MENDEDKTGFLQKFNTSFVAPTLLIASGVSTFFSVRAADEAKLAQQHADRARAHAETEATIRGTDRADRALDRDYQYKIAELTLASMETQNIPKQRALLVIVQTLPEPMGPQMVKALSFSESPDVAAGAKRVLAATEDFEASGGTANKAGAAGPQIAVSQPAATPQSRSQLLASGDPKGWDIDIFWCQGATAEAVLYSRARAVAEALADKAKEKRKIGSLTLGRIRLRPISTLTNNAPGYRIYANVIRAEAAESDPARDVAAFAQQQGSPVAVTASTQKTPYYISMFFCGSTA